MAQRIKVVLDTSVLISALKSKDLSKSPAWKIIKALQEGEIVNFVSNEIIEEMQTQVLGIGLETGLTRRALRILTIVLKNSITVRPRKKLSHDIDFIKKLKDPNDAKFFDVAYAKKVDYIISENTKHILQMRDETTKTYRFDGRNVKILGAGEFVREVLR
ncbi:putative toxin-antitoxin system toxin component, PIN family [Thermococcus sp. MAR1]|uniref:putative toxin-antitoxin system toxin component, PIN family n=1 Tax=Thermococcus sp. MAR1 TaxID=1638263 RepID=UPI00143B8921|nr:putative toxin-antitoxin system toxin component, PIN family [Thermococcus sp. MAR1]NJE10534.1 putative toxin-antitoxin system toxin component, PIN family [Thermococcus sp. MAR1]